LQVPNRIPVRQNMTVNRAIAIQSSPIDIKYPVTTVASMLPILSMLLQTPIPSDRTELVKLSGVKVYIALWPWKLKKNTTDERMSVIVKLL
jgi:hypothetical protein